MLVKLIKQEFKATGRIFLPLYGLLLLFSIVTKFITDQQNLSASFSGLLQVIPVFLYACIIIAITVMSFVMLIQRFSKNLLGDEGYLSHTLPVRPFQHLLCKVLTSTVWCLLSLFFVLCSVFYMAADVSDWGTLWTNFQNLLDTFGNMLKIDASAAFWGLMLLVIVYAMEKTLMIYAGMSIGQCASKQKVGLSIVAILVMTIAEQFLTFGALRLLSQWTGTAFFHHAYTGTDIVSLFQWYIACAVVFGVLYVAICNWMLKRHLNLA